MGGVARAAKKGAEAKATGFLKQTVVIALCSALYAMMTSPMLWHAQNANAMNAARYSVVVVVGLATQWAGVLLEAAADHQKYKFKATERGKTRWCDEGLYTRCRHPNYLGELLFWIGTYVRRRASAMLTLPVTFILGDARTRVHRQAHAHGGQARGRETIGEIRG